MRIAICFYGKVGGIKGKNGKGDAISLDLIKKYYDKSFENYKVDYFIHSWSLNHEQKFNQIFKPKMRLFEDQKDFPVNKAEVLKSKNMIRKKVKIYKLLFKKKYDEILNKECLSYFRAQSRWYSTMKSTELLENYSNKNNIKYDFVFLIRPDVVFLRKLNLNELDRNNFYVSNWNNQPMLKNLYKADYKNNNKDFGVLDFWFISKLENIKIFSKLYQNFSSYDPNPHVASYQHIIKNNLPLKYIYYRWHDHEMLRRFYYGSRK